MAPPDDEERARLAERREELKKRYVKPTGARPASHFFFDLGNSTLLGFFDFPGLGLEPAQERIGTVQHIAIGVPPDKHAELQKKLDDAGIPYDGPQRGIPESLYLRDPDGIGIELLSDELMFFGGRYLDR